MFIWALFDLNKLSACEHILLETLFHPYSSQLVLDSFQLSFLFSFVSVYSGLFFFFKVIYIFLGSKFLSSYSKFSLIERLQ